MRITLRMLTFLSGLLVISAALDVSAVAKSQSTAASAQNSCVKCHFELGDELAVPVGLVQNDVHGRRGFSCIDCHGGDPKDDDLDRSMDPKKGFVGKPTPRQVQSFCGKCHSNAEFMKRY